MFVSLFIHAKDAQDFETFAKHLFTLLNISIKETRFSDNSPGGGYSYGEVMGLRVTLEQADDSDFPDYDFLLSIKPQIRITVEDHCLDGFADVLSKYLSKQGLKIARPLQPGRAGTPRLEYEATYL